MRGRWMLAAPVWVAWFGAWVAPAFGATPPHAAARAAWLRGAACAVAGDERCARRECVGAAGAGEWLGLLCEAVIDAHMGADAGAARSRIETAFGQLLEASLPDVAARYRAADATVGEPRARHLVRVLLLTGSATREADVARAALRVHWAREAAATLVAAERGDGAAQLEACMRHESGIGVDADAAAAVRWCARAAAQGVAKAQMLLAGYHRDGTGVAQDPAEALRWMRSAAQAGDSAAQYGLARMYDKGSGVARDRAQALAWFERAAQQGHVEARFATGWRYEHGKGVAADPAAAVRWYRLAAEQGHAAAQNNVALLFAEGRGVAADPVEALRWFRRAAEQGVVAAQASLGQRLLYGTGVAADPAQGLEWLRRSAARGSDGAQELIGLAYYSGRGVAVDHAEAARWLQLAADQGNPHAENALGTLYLSGKGVTQDSARAVALFRLAAGAEVAEAQFNLARAYLTGNGVERDTAQAAQWFRRAAEQGDADAQLQLGLLVGRGDGVDQDRVEGGRWIAKAATQGLAEAQLRLGMMYASGSGVDADPAQAEAWYRKAAAQGVTAAQHELDKLVREVAGSDTDGTPADPRAPAYACPDDASCTVVQDVRPALATRDAVRRTLEAGGAIARREDRGFASDVYQAPPSAAYAKIDAAYHEDRLWSLAFEYRDPAAIDAVLAELVRTYGEPDEAMGGFAIAEFSHRVWLRPDGVRIVLRRYADETRFEVDYGVPAVRAGYDAARAAAPGRAAVAGDRAATVPPADPDARADAGVGAPAVPPEPAPVETVELSRDNGVLLLSAGQPVFFGARELRIEACGDGEDFESLGAFAAPETAFYVERRDDGSLRAKVGIVDDFANPVYEFAELRPGVATLSPPVGDGSQPRVTALYTPVVSAECLRVVQVNRSPRAVLERVVAVTGITLEGLEAMPDEPNVTFNMSLPLGNLLELLSDVSGRTIERLDATRYVVRATPPPGAAER